MNKINFHSSSYLMGLGDLGSLGDLGVLGDLAPHSDANCIIFY